MKKLFLGDCRDVLAELIRDGVKVAAVICDPPYGTINGISQKGYNKETTAWDVAIDPAEIFPLLSQILKPNGRAVLFSQEPYTANLITGAIPSLPFNYRMVWKKNSAGNRLSARSAMVNEFEDILLFTKQEADYYRADPELRPVFRRILLHVGEGDLYLGRRRIMAACGGPSDHCTRTETIQFEIPKREIYNQMVETFGLDSLPDFIQYDEIEARNNHYKETTTLRDALPTFNLWQGGRSKSNVLEYSKDVGGAHPTQKPVALMADLIRTFTNPGDTVLDFTMGSGSTGVACIKTDREFIGIEKFKNWYDHATARLDLVEREKREQLNLFEMEA